MYSLLASTRRRTFAVFHRCPPKRPLAVNGRALHTSELWTKPLSEVDDELHSWIQDEAERDRSHMNLLASENYTSLAVRQALSIHVEGAEGYPGSRHYGGKRSVDELERICKRRALAAFKLSPDVWDVNVQALSGALANLYVYTSLLPPSSKIMGLDIPSGGHLSHGFRTATRAISEVAHRFTSIPYRTSPATGLIDYASLSALAQAEKPSIIVAGASAYSRLIDYPLMRAIADKAGALLHADIAHIAGPIAAGVMPSPFEYSDVVTTTSAKTLRGPKAALIFMRKEYSAAINRTVFPRFQSGSNHRNVLALAVGLREACQPEFKAYQQAVLDNARTLADALMSHGLELLTKGTDNHSMIINVRPNGIDGALAERMLGLVHVTGNRNLIQGDTSAARPSGLRLGTAPMTMRGLSAAGFREVARIIAEALRIAPQLAAVDHKHWNDEETLESLDIASRYDVEALKAWVVREARKLPNPQF